MPSSWVGAPVLRREDDRLVRGRGRFVDDVHVAEMLHGAVLRSAIAHARIVALDVTAARALPGVHAVYTAADLGRVNRPFPLPVPHPQLRPRTPQPLATDKVRYVGEPIAFVVADDRYIAEDALDLIELELEELPPTPTLEGALSGTDCILHEELGDNVAARFGQSYGDVDEAFARADVVVRERLVSDRSAGQPMETRSLLAVPDEATGNLTLWDTTQAPHVARRLLATILEISEDQVHVIAPDVGGGFGPKVIFYPEEVLVPFAARALRRPVKWVEDRLEHFRATVQERTQIHEFELAATKDGMLLGMRVKIVHDTGAYVPWGVIVPFITLTTVPGPYRLPAYEAEATVVYTNRVPVTPHRGAGRPQAVFTMERAMDRLAQEVGLDRAEVRARNYIPADAFPYDVGLIYRDGSPMRYDSGDYPEAQRVALDAIGYARFGAEQASLRARGRYVGIGFAGYVEGTGLGPHESARLRVDTTGKVRISSGAASQGQGHQTTLAQVAADALGMDMDDIVVTTGDTDGVPYGIGAFASRLGALASSAVKIGATELREKIFRAAGALFEVAIEDLELADGTVRVKGSPSQAIRLGDLAVQTSGAFPGSTLPKDLQEIGLETTAYFRPAQSTYASGFHAVKVEVDPQTGLVQILRYVVSHDCGNAINPMIVEGQVQGGVAAGVGGALYEHIVYDEGGQIVTGSFVDFLLPTAAEVPDAEIHHIHAPTPLNPLGAKGAGEGGTIPAPAAIVSAVENALWPHGDFHLRSFPLGPEDVRRAAFDGGAIAE
ncbi:MAG: xanthine dehydrogenase, molybdenum binding subunit apoprotein [Candidatus Eremiobacteraeota bacterium]|nr:xanthine dehydrogenase, molybdenum binding subunit apoprotein [Candidatus Eremiobacteraeota bacterium]